MSQSILALLENTAECLPDSVALADETGSLTFEELLSLSRRIGHWLRSKGLGDRPIAVLAEHTIHTPALYWGVAYAGGCYVPLDPEAPEEKRHKILSDCGAPVVLGWQNGDISCTAMEQEPLDDFPDSPPQGAAICGDTPLYMIYTSGSTGEPKGLVKTHGAVLDFLEAYLSTFSFTEQDILGSQTPFFFDAAAKDLYVMLAAGCRMELVPKQLFTQPVRLIEFLNQRRITIISWVPSALTVISRLNTFRTVKPETLRRVMFVGEVFQTKQLNRWRDACPDVEFVNLYGSSEIAGICCYHIVREALEDDQPLPIGKPLPNCLVRLAEGDRLIDRPGVLGEILISSKALALGYFKNEEKTRERFFTADLGEGPRRWFRSGDLAQYNENGDLVFASRTDHQIKHMGHRIELGEIEAAAAALPGVTLAACVYQKEREAICLFWTGSEQESRSLAAALRQVLPSYMIPKKYFYLEDMPLTPSGKTDRIQLERSYLS